MAAFTGTEAAMGRTAAPRTTCCCAQQRRTGNHVGCQTVASFLSFALMVDVLAYLATVLVRIATHPASRIDELCP